MKISPPKKDSWDRSCVRELKITNNSDFFIHAFEGSIFLKKYAVKDFPIKWEMQRARRPMAMQPEEALSQLRFERVGNHLKVSNASPYYITLVNLKLGGQTLENLMVAPKNSAQQVLPTAASGTLSWQSVNDYGAITPARSVNL